MGAPHWRLLGALAPGDQRLAERDGAFYLFDNSGSSPDTTDDGPLRINREGFVYIYTDGCAVPVFVERDRDESRVMVTHAGMRRLRALVPNLTFRVGAKEVQDLWNLFKELGEE
jgi:hypothetical protein